MQGEIMQGFMFKKVNGSESNLCKCKSKIMQNS